MGQQVTFVVWLTVFFFFKSASGNDDIIQTHETRISKILNTKDL